MKTLQRCFPSHWSFPHIDKPQDLCPLAAPEATERPVLELPKNVTNCLTEVSISPTAYKGTTQRRLNGEAV